MRKAFFLAVLAVLVMVSMIVLYTRPGELTERSTLIGAGILGMAVIYALSWIYHSYIRKSHD